VSQLDPIEIFRRRVTNAAFWWETGEHLLTSAKTLWPHVAATFELNRANLRIERDAIAHRDPYYLLAGCAIECFLKAVRVKQLFRRTGEHASSEMPTPRLPRGFANGHNLVRLAEDAGFVLSEHERWLLQRWSVFVKWAGRYPVNTSPGALAPNFVVNSDHQNLVAFVSRVRDAYEALPRQSVMLDGSL
jgi:hypothetical protein